MIEIYGKCGNACQVCRHYGSTCKGCQLENEENPGKYNCLIYNCTIEKDIRSCLSCIEYPCRLIIGISRAYCPVHTLKDL